jgi:hypothetical protein
MDPHVFLTNHAISSQDGLTAFSALPNAPVLPYKERRRWLPRGVGALRARRTRPVRRLTPATTAGNPCA